MQKPLKSKAKKKDGRLAKDPKKAVLKARHVEDQALTKAINAENEQRTLGVAANNGGKLSVLQPPVHATADEKQRKKASNKPGKLWGMSSK